MMWIFQYNTGTSAGRPSGLSSCLVSEHKLIVLHDPQKHWSPWPQVNFLPWFQSHLLYQKDDDTHFPCWKHQWWLRNNQWLSAVVKENIFIKILHLPSLFWWICSLSKTQYTRNQHNCAEDSVISLFSNKKEKWIAKFFFGLRCLY